MAPSGDLPLARTGVTVRTLVGERGCALWWARRGRMSMRVLDRVRTRVVGSSGRRAGWTACAAVMATVASTLLLIVSTAPAQANATDCNNLEILAHRGYHNNKISENTLAAFDAAATRGYSIETDVWSDAQGQLWIFHDRDPFRTTGVHGFIDQMTTAQVTALRYKKTGAAIPTFQEGVALWQTYSTHIQIYLEPKNQPTAAAVVPLVQAAGLDPRLY